MISWMIIMYIQCILVRVSILCWNYWTSSYVRNILNNVCGHPVWPCNWPRWTIKLREESNASKPATAAKQRKGKKPKPKSARKKAKKATWVAAGNWGEILSIWVQIALYRLVVLLSIWNCLQSWPNAGQQLHRVSVGLPTSVTRLVEVYILFSCLGNVIYMMLNCYTHSCHSLLNGST